MTRQERSQLIAALRREARELARVFSLPPFRIAADRRDVRRYGVCYSDGAIRIRLVHARTGRPLRWSSLVNTLCHELAHLRHLNHGPAFKALYLEILGWARRRGVYRPGTPAPRSVPGPLPAQLLAVPARAPTQLSLFEQHGPPSRGPRPRAATIAPRTTRRR